MNKYGAILDGGSGDSSKFLGFYNAVNQNKARDKVAKERGLYTEAYINDHLGIVEVKTNGVGEEVIKWFDCNDLHDCEDHLMFVEYVEDNDDYVCAIMECDVCGSRFEDVYEFAQREQID